MTSTMLDKRELNDAIMWLEWRTQHHHWLLNQQYFIRDRITGLQRPHWQDKAAMVKYNRAMFTPRFRDWFLLQQWEALYQTWLHGKVVRTP